LRIGYGLVFPGTLVEVCNPSNKDVKFLLCVLK
jgi:hypothetical protein